MVLEPKEWSGTNDWMDGVKDHLDKFKQALSGEIIAKMGESNNDAVEEFEMTGGEVIKILQLLASLIVEGREVGVVMGIMQLWKQQKDEVCEAGLELLTATAAQLTDKDTVSITSSPILLLETLASQYPLPGPEVSDTLSTLCTDEKVSVSDRLALVRILKGLEVTATSSNELDSSFLADLYQTQHDIQNILPTFTVVNGDLEGTQSRLDLFHRLVTACSCAQEVTKVYSLVKEWEVLETGELLSSVACRLLDLDTEGEQVLELLSGAEEELSKSEAARVLEHYEGFHKPKELLVVQLVLVLGVEERYPEVTQVLADQESCSATLASLIVRRGLVPHLVTCTIYPSLVAACLEVGGELVDSVVTQLRAAGQGPLAASIQMQSEGVPGGLRTLTSLAMRWLTK